MEEYKLVLKKAFAEAEQRELAKIPDDDAIDWTPSPAFEKKMKKLIKTQRHMGRKHPYTIGKRVVIVLIAAIIALIFAMSVEASRDAIIKFYKSVFDEGTTLNIYASSENEKYLPQEIEQEYTIAPNMTDDFIMTYYYKDSLQVRKEWKDRNNKTDVYELHQTIVDRVYGFNTEGTEMEKVIINGYTVYTYNQKNSANYIWSEKGYVFYLRVPSDAGDDFAKSVIGCLEPAK